MTKKFLTGAGAAAIAAVFAMALIAGAQTTTATGAGDSSGTASENPILEVGQAGRVLMRGTIASIGSGSLTVNSWGGTWTVNLASGAEIMPAAAGNDLTQFKVGDFVGVQGTVSTAASWTIDATLVRDWTFRAAVVQERQTNVENARQTIQSGTPRNYMGTASNVGASSLTLTGEGGNVWTVAPTANAEVVNRNWITIPFASIQNGDNVRTWGVNASGTITAQIVRDTSIPAAAAAPIAPSSTSGY